MKNVTTTVNLLNACTNNDVKNNFFLIICIYGENTNPPLKETELPMPTSPMHLQKHVANYILNHFMKVWFEVYCIKIF